ncbi:MAG: hypothetical protein ACOVQ4_20875 [Flectobacillus sp.]|uniref:hypothetical protein n=1 Tax=Flectobacillus sp. TaxID=50419 RepID=UPI003B9B121A
MRNDNSKELEELRKEIELLKQRKGLFSGLTEGAQNTFKSPLTSIVSVLFASPVVYKGIIQNDTTLISLGLGIVSNGLLTNEKNPQ